MARELVSALRNYAKVSQISAVRPDKDMKYTIPNRLLDSAAIYSKLKSLDSKRRIDIVHLFNVSHLMTSTLTKFFLKKSTIAHVFGASSGGELLSKKFIDAYICTSKLNYSHLISKGVPTQKVHIVPPIIDCDVYRPLTEKLMQRKLGFSRNSFLITYIGNVFPERFPLDLIKELKKITNPNLEMAIYAPDSMWNRKIALRFERLLLESKIKLHLMVSNLNECEKLSVYNTSDVLVFPFNMVKEVKFDPPLTVLEAMACGKIVIASRTLGIPEIISHGENGFLVSPGNYEDFRNTIEYVMDHLQEIQFIGINARKTIQKHFSPKVITTKLMEVYSSVLE